MTDTTERRRPDVHEMVRDLTRTHQERERYDYDAGTGSRWSTWHTTDVPSLVLQLLGATPAGSGQMTRTHPQSRPAARIECLDTVMLIDDEASRWVKRLGHDDPGDRYVETARAHPQAGPACPSCSHPSCTAVRRGDLVVRTRVRGSGTIACVRLLGSLHASARHCGSGKAERDKTKPYAESWCCQRHHLEHDVRHWWHQARIITGWDTPALKPHNTCPICDAHDSLRVRVDVDQGIVDSAMCVECREVWEDADQISLLALHIKIENGDDAA